MVFGRETGIRVRRVWSRQRRAVTGRFRRPVVICPPRISQYILELRGTACDLDRYLLYLCSRRASYRAAQIIQSDGETSKRDNELGTQLLLLSYFWWLRRHEHISAYVSHGTVQADASRRRLQDGRVCSSSYDHAADWRLAF